jgi:hypothetical protein
MHLHTFPSWQRLAARFLLALQLGVVVLSTAGCGTQVVTERPLTVEETQELDEQRAMIEKQFAKDPKQKKAG